MKNFFKALGKAVLYALFFFVVQGFAGIIQLLSQMFVYTLKYPALAQLNPVELYDTIMKMSADSQQAQILLSILLSGLLTVTLLWLFFRLRKKKFAVQIQLAKTDRKNLALALVIGLCTPMAVSLVTNLFPFSQEQVEQLEEYSAFLPAQVTLLSFVTTAIVGPIAEEVVFRGLVYTRLRKGMGVIASIVISAVLFGKGHGGDIWFLSAFLGGVLMAYLLETTGSLYVPIIVHITNNTLADFLPDQIEHYFWIALSALVILIIAVIALTKHNRSPRNFPGSAPIQP